MYIGALPDAYQAGGCARHAGRPSAGPELRHVLHIDLCLI